MNDGVNNLKMHLLTVIIALFATSQVQSARILGIFAASQIRHNAVFESLVQELALRSHQIAVVTPYPIDNPPNNYTQIDLIPSIGDEINSWKSGGKVTDSHLLEKLFSDSRVKKLLDEQSFDLVITNDVILESLAAFAHYFKVPRIVISPISGSLETYRHFDYPILLAHLSNALCNKEIGYVERLMNVVNIIIGEAYDQIYYMPYQENLRKQLFRDKTPSVWELRGSTCLAFVNNHFSTSYPHVLLPAMIEVGGMHIKETPGSLPLHLQNFLNKAAHGAIYISLDEYHENTRNIQNSSLLSLIETLPYNVIIDSKSLVISGLPNNVKISKSLSQSILAHHNLKVVITNGDILSMQEAVYYKVPVLGISSSAGEQFQNLKKAEKDGYAVIVSEDNITKSSIADSLQYLMHDASIQRKVSRQSTILRDQPETPLKRAIFWVEYVLRHGCAQHIRSSFVKLPWYQIYSLDVIATLLLILFLPLSILVHYLNYRYDLFTIIAEESSKACKDLGTLFGSPKSMLSHSKMT